MQRNHSPFGSVLLRRRLNSLAAIAVLSASLLVANSGEAQARISQVQDGFEGNPRANWVVATGGSASADFDLALGAAHSGDNNGWLLARDGWAFEGYWVPTNSVPGNAQCAAQFYMRSISNAQVGIEIWDAHDTCSSLRTPSSRVATHIRQSIRSGGTLMESIRFLSRQ